MHNETIQPPNTSKYTTLLANLGIFLITIGTIFVHVKEWDWCSHLTLVFQKCYNPSCTMPTCSKEAVKWQKEEEVMAAAIVLKKKSKQLRRISGTRHRKLQQTLEWPQRLGQPPRTNHQPFLHPPPTISMLFSQAMSAWMERCCQLPNPVRMIQASGCRPKNP
jgi:hypothetical protein